MDSMDEEAWRERLEHHMMRSDEAMRHADATMLSQAEREMDLKTFIREERIQSDRATGSLLRESADMRDEIRATTAATWAMVDEIRGWSA